MTAMYDRRTMLKLLGAGTGALVLPGCIPTGGGRGHSAGGGEGSLDIASFILADEATKAGLQNLIDTYVSEKDLEVHPFAVSFPEYDKQMILKVAAAEFSGGVLHLEVGKLGAFAETGKLRDVSDLTEGIGYTETALSSGQLNGTQYGVPWTSGAIGMIANDEILRSVGVQELPSTIEEFEDVLTEIKATGVIPYAAITKVAELKDILIWMQTFGSELVVDGEVTLGDEPSLEALAWYKSLYDKELIAPDVERIDARTLFSQGRTAMYDDAIVGKGVLADTASDPELVNKVSPYPRPVLEKGDKPRALQWGHLMAIVEGDGAETASEFAVWATSDTEAVLEYFKTVELPPATVKGVEAKPVQDDEFTSAFNDRITATATQDPFWRFPQYPQIQAAISEHVQSVLVSDVSPEEAMTNAREEIQELM